MSLLNEMLRDLNKRSSQRPTILLMPALNKRWVETLPKTLCGIVIIVSLPFLIYGLTYSYWHAALVANTPKPQPEQLISMIQPIPSVAGNVVRGDIRLEEDDTLVPDVVSINKKMTDLTPEEWHDEQLNKALEAMQDGADERAISLLELILTQFPASVEARENLAAIYLSYEEMGKANDILDGGLKFEPRNLRLTTMKSRVLVAQGRHQDALKLLQQFNPDINKAPDYYGLLAAIYEALGRMTEAGSLYQTLVKIDPSNGQYWLGFGMALENKQAHQQAIDAYKRASQSENIQPSVRFYAEDRLKILQG